jgi:hypothetical protein
VVPTPAPTSSPSPAPTATYIPADFSANFAADTNLAYIANFQTYAGAGGLPEQSFVSGMLIDPTHSSKIIYQREPEQVDFGYDGTSITFVGQERISSSTPRRFERNAQTEVLFVEPFDTDLHPRYVVQAVWRSLKPIVAADGTTRVGEQYRLALFGTPTVGDNPLPDFVSYLGSDTFFGGVVSGQTQYRGFNGYSISKLSWSYTPSIDRLDGSIDIRLARDGSSNDQVLLRPSGKFDRATNTVSGTLSDTISGLSGTFRGRFFGPDRAELALVFEISRASDGAKYVGSYIGLRQR